MLAHPFHLSVRPKNAEKDMHSTTVGEIAFADSRKSRWHCWIAMVPQALGSLVILAVFLPVILCMYAAYYLHQSD